MIGMVTRRKVRQRLAPRIAEASRSIITGMSLCLIFQDVVWVTPSRRPNSMLEMPPLL
jgi:hypothetical protein